MKDNIKRKVEEMYKDVKNRSVELVFYNNGLKKSIAQRKPTPDLLKELNDELNDGDNIKSNEQQ